MGETTQDTQKRTLRLKSLKVTNFKALDELELEFPAPRMPIDHDVTVIGSANGVGKTSVLEAIALMTLGSILDAFCAASLDMFLRAKGEYRMDLPNMLIRAGRSSAIIEGGFDYEERERHVTLHVNQGSFVRGGSLVKISELDQWAPPAETSTQEQIRGRFNSLLGISTEPLILPPLLYFHSYRKVREGNPSLGDVIGSENGGSSRTPSIDTFKRTLLYSLIGRAGLMEDVGEEQAGEALAVLGDLLDEYADARIAKLRSPSESALEFRVSVRGGGPFPFDALSSGQKEMISTLFLIWHSTREGPGIILIDEPELHLNAEWHGLFFRKIMQLVKDRNCQVIAATHSEDVFASVEDYQRVVLHPNRG